MRGYEYFEGGHVGYVVTERRSSWLRPTLLIFGFVIVAAILVMVVVSNADFDTGPTKVTPPPGPCAPFCTAPAAPPGQ